MAQIHKNLCSLTLIWLISGNPVSYGDLVLTSRSLYNCSFQFYLCSGLEFWLAGFFPSHCISRYISPSLRLGAGTSLVVQFPMQGTWVQSLVGSLDVRSHIPQLRVCMLQLKILHATTKTQCSQINKFKLKKKQNSLGLSWSVSPSSTDLRKSVFTKEGCHVYNHKLGKAAGYCCCLGAKSWSTPL